MKHVRINKKQNLSILSNCGMIVYACALLTFFLMPDALAVNRKIIVAQDGTGDFKEIGKAIDGAKDATQVNQIDIIIKPGTYLETIKTVDWVNLIGENRETCIVKFDGGEEDTVYKHTIWATSNTIIKNLTLIGGEVKYVIHSDGGRAYVLTIEDCTLRREYPNKNSRMYPAAFGIGLRGDQHIIMKNCLLEATFPLWQHNWDDQKKPCSMTLENCTIKGEDYAVRIYNFGSGQRDTFVFHNCVLTGAKGSIQYKNQRNIKGVTWHGEDEIKVMGHGNKMSDPVGVEIIDDNGNGRTDTSFTNAPVSCKATEQAKF